MFDTSPHDAALAYAQDYGWHVFPVGTDKKPLTPHGCLDATTDAATIKKWFSRWPRAIVGLATGAASGVIAVDVDVRPEHDGRDSLKALGVLPHTATAYTPSGGFHLLFKHPGERVRNSASKVAPGVDIRGDGGYIVLPPGPGRYWSLAPDQVGFGPSPDWARPSEPVRPTVQPVSVPLGDGCTLTRYGEAAINSAVAKIVNAPNGQQEATLNREAFSIGQLVAGGEIPESLAEDALRLATRQMPNFDPHRPWTSIELERKIATALAAGVARPRRGAR